MAEKKPSQLRYEYSGQGLSERNASLNPVSQFRVWFNDAVAGQALMPNAMTLATIDARKRPATRIVLLKDFSPKGFVFYTHYDSPKGREIGKSPYCSLLFYWPKMERQVRIDGAARKVSSAASDAYFRSRPRPYQVQAHLANQSQVIESRAALETRYKELEEQFRGKKVPRPEDWGGYCLTPDYFEFWQGQPSRLHDRLRYRLVRGKWIRERLAP